MYRTLLPLTVRVCAAQCQSSVGVARTLCSTPTPFSKKVYEEGLKQVLIKEIEGIKEAGTYKVEREITSPQAASIRVKGSTRPVLNFCANNYLGLSDDKGLVNTAKEYLDSHGFGLSSVRFICGTQDIHRQLEQKIADFHGYNDAILYASCFDANAGIFEAILNEEDAVISDSLNHASIIDGVRLCKAKRFRYEHMKMDDLKRCLEESKGCRTRLIVTDGVFSMDGDVAPLKDICDLADEYGALVMVDDCHATGFMGETGRGTPEHCGVFDRVDIVNSTLGKAMGGATGGYTAARPEIVEILRQRSRPYLFSNALAPNLVGATLKVFDLISSDLSRLSKLQANTDRFRSRMTEAGFTLSGTTHPIAPVMLGDAKVARDMSNDMLDRGIYVVGFSYPVVPKGKARIRVQLSAAHSTDQVDECVDAFIETGKKHNVIS